MASENGSEAEDTQESDNDTENDSEETKSNSHETSTIFHSENPCEHCENSNVHGTLIMKCPKCSWHDSYNICLICDNQISEERNNTREGFLRCHDCGATTHKNAKTLETTFGLINIHPFQISVFYSFCHCFPIKFLKRYLVSVFFFF